MSNVVYFNSYKLKKSTKIPDFIDAISTLIKENITSAKGYVSSALLIDGETWADFSIWETMDDLNAFIASSNEKSSAGDNELAHRFYSYCNFNTGRSHRFMVMDSYNFDIKQLTVPHVISYHSYKLNKGTSDSAFLSAIKKVNVEFSSKQKGWLSSLTLNDGKIWADIVIMESKEALDQFAEACHKSEVTHDVFSYMDFNGMKGHTFTLEHTGCFK